MIEPNIDTDKIEGLDNLYRSFPQDYSFEGVSFNGILLHDNGEVQLTYTLDGERTYTFVFLLSECVQDYRMAIAPKCPVSKGIDISNDNGFLHFVEQTNGIGIKCRHISLAIHETLSRAFGKEQANILTERYSQKLQKKFEVLDKLELDNGEPLFRRDDSYNGIASTHHTMYKLANLTCKDRGLEYEFLIEMDRNDPCLGIYYGCKGLIKDGDNLDQQNVLRDEWEKTIKKNVEKRLKALFPEKNFTNRFKPTDNANDNTFWPFWITLYEDENILEVGVRALIIIRDEYKRCLEGDSYEKDATSRFVIGNVEIGADEVHSTTCFTGDCWEDLRCNPWKKSSERIYNVEWNALFDRFIEGALREGVLIEHERYEKAYKMNCKTNRFAILLQLLINRIQGEVSVPWGKVAKNFVDQNGDVCTADSLKNAEKGYMKDKKKEYEKEGIVWNYYTKQAYENKEFPDKHVVIFKEIMK